ncbi:MAG: hypothetical protein KDC56_01565 [Flavobacteriaceae bacterium]|nr:hypothetical protein [Flavobacteriaceae bacterium]
MIQLPLQYRMMMSSDYGITISGVKYNSKEEIMNAILNDICIFSGLTKSDIKGRSRKEEVMPSRRVFCYLIRHHFGYSYRSIGEFLGGRDHATILHNYKLIENLIDNLFQYPEEEKLIEHMKGKIFINKPKGAKL